MEMTTKQRMKAEKIRALNDEDLLQYINDRIEKARAEERNRWRRKAGGGNEKNKV